MLNKNISFPKAEAEFYLLWCLPKAFIYCKMLQHVTLNKKTLKGKE